MARGADPSGMQHSWAPVWVLVVLTAVPGSAAGLHLLGRSPNPAVMVGVGTLLVALVTLRLLRLMHALEGTRAALEHQAAYHRALATVSSDATVVLEEDDTVRYGTVSVASLLRRDDLADFRTDPLELVHPDDRPIAAALVTSARRSPGSPVRGEVRTAPSTPTATEQWVELRIVDLAHDPVIGGLVINIHDATTRKQLEHELAHHAFHDDLTGLANRALLHDRIDHALARAGRDLIEVGVILCDLDGLRTVNDSLGHDVGDELLSTIAERLQGLVRGSDTLARFGGDEFAVLIEGSGDLTADTETVAGRMLEAIERPMTLGGTEIVVSASIGIARSAEGGATATELLRHADLAMYASKHRGRNLVTHYHPQMGSAAVARLELDADLRGAAARGEMELWFQPVLDLTTSAVVGFEALVRWRHPRRGLLFPGDFIDIAEGNGAILEIGDRVLGDACAALRAWDTANGFHPPLTVSVNVSARQLTDPRLPERFRDIIVRSGVDPARIVLELTESALVDEPELAAAHLRALRELGTRIAIDDFGTGYSSLSYLRQFPVDIVKIDRSFVDTIESDAAVPPIIHGMLELGRSLGLETVAEGIEHHHQAATLAAAGCDLGQGYHFARPLPARNAGEVAASRRVVPADTPA